MNEKNTTIKNIDILAELASSKLLLLEKLEKSMKRLYDEFEKGDDFDIDVHLKEQQNCIADIDKLDAHFKTILQTLDEKSQTTVNSIIGNSNPQNVPAWGSRLSQIIKNQRMILLSLQEINSNNIIHAQKLSAKFRAKIKEENKKKFIQEHYAKSSTAAPGQDKTERPAHRPILSIV